MKLRLWSITLLTLMGVEPIGSTSGRANSKYACTRLRPVLRTGFKNFGAGSGTLGNSGGALTITETSATPGTGAAWSDGFNTIKRYGSAIHERLLWWTRPLRSDVIISRLRPQRLGARECAVFRAGERGK